MGALCGPHVPPLSANDMILICYKNKGVWTATKGGRITIYNYLRDVHVIVSQLTWFPSTHEPMAGGFQFPPFSIIVHDFYKGECLKPLHVTIQERY